MVPRPTNLLLLLKREAEFQRQREGEEDSAELAQLFEWAAEEIEDLERQLDTARSLIGMSV